MKNYGQEWLAILNCGYKKKDRPDIAKSFYTGTNFRSAVIFAERECENYCIISAKYGLLLPEDIVEPYDVYIKELTSSEIDNLFKECSMRIKEEFPSCDKFLFLTSKAYSDLSKYLDGYCEFPLLNCVGRQTGHFLRTGDDKKVDLNDVFEKMNGRIKRGTGYTKKYLIGLLEEFLPNYSPTYYNRIIDCSISNKPFTGSSKLRHRDIFELHNEKYYLFGSYNARKLF